MQRHDLGESSATSWDEALGGYLTCARNAAGRLEGRAEVRREDGSLSLEGHFSDGERHGSFKSYHPSGKLASSGRYEHGRPTGFFSRFADDQPGAIPLRSCCVPPGARELRIRYEAGSALGQSFHDAQGRALCSDGTPWPAVPTNLDDSAEFDETRHRWLTRISADISRYFDLDGKLVETTRTEQGRLVERSLYDASAQLFESTRLEKGKPHGPYYRAYAERAPYSDPRIRAERGEFSSGHQVGRWQFLGADGSVLYDKDRGSMLSAEQLSALCELELHGASAEEFARLSEECLAQGQVRSALWWTLRSVGRSQSDVAQKELSEQLLLPLHPGEAAAWTQTTGRISKFDIPAALDALLAGAHPVRLVQLLAVLLPEGHAAALDFANAAVALSKVADPETKGGARTSRALRRLAHGDLDGARADAEEAARLTKKVDALTEVQQSERSLFRGFDFGEVTEEVAPANPELPEVFIGQALPEVQQILALYATRLALCRERIEEYLERDGLPQNPGWLPPKLLALMPDGPVTLRQFSATIEDSDEEGRCEYSQVEIDEHQGLDGTSVRSLLQTAHADWDALAWLCWAVGLATPALPDDLECGRELAPQVNQTMQRCYRAHDQLKTGGIVSRSKGLPSFTTFQQPIESVHRSLLPLVARKLLERRSMFFWLMFPENLSPFQSDLRRL